jgi:chemotaxis protein MotB
MHKLIGFIMILGTAIGTQGCVFKSDHEALLADKASVDQELAATQVTLNTTRDSVAELEAEVGELKTLFDGAQIQNQELAGQIGNLGNQVQSIKSELGTTETRVSELSALTAKDRERRVSAHQMLADLNTALAAAQEQFNTVHTQFETAQEAQAKKEKRLQGLDRTRVILAKRVNQLQAENKALKLQKEEAMDLAKQLADEKSQALGKASSLDGEKSEAMQRIDALEQKHANLESEKERLAQDLAILQADKNVLQADKSALATKSTELENAKTILEQEKAKLAESEQEAKNLISKLEEDISAKDVKISELSGVVTVDLDNSILFRAGSAKLGKQGRKTLQEVAEALEKSPDRVIRVYGHTDSTTAPEGAYYRNNWGLSALRAASVVSFLVEAGIEPKDVAAVGFGATRPIGDNETREGRDLNRRIEIVLVPKIKGP